MISQENLRKLDVLALAAHPDDIELSAGGTVCSLTSRGRSVGVVDMTRGELGSRGTPELRAREAEAASQIMGLSIRENLGIPDGNIENSVENQRKVIEVIRRYRPHMVLVNAPVCRHPDHEAAARLSISAIFYAGLTKIETEEPDGSPQVPWRPSHVLHYMQNVSFDPTVVVDVTSVWDQRIKALQAFSSQFWSEGAVQDEPQTFISSQNFFEWVEARARTFGYRIGATYAEPWLYHQGPFGTNDLFHVFERERRY